MKFAVVSAWPEVKNAEYECIERIKLSATNIGSECIVVDNEGNIDHIDFHKTDPSTPNEGYVRTENRTP